MEARITGQAANPSLDETIVPQARVHNGDLSHAAEEGSVRAVKTERERLWRLENTEAIAEMNDNIDKNGLPLAEFRQF